MKNIVICLLLAISFCFISEASAEELTAIVSGIVGEVTVVRGGESEGMPAEEGMELAAWDLIITGKESFVTLTFLPNNFIELASDSELEIMLHEINDETAILNTRVDVQSGHISKAVLSNLPPDALFEIILPEFMPAEAEAYHTPEELVGISTVSWYDDVFMRKDDMAKAMISNVTGIVEIIRVGEVQSILAKDGMALGVGDILKTGRDSYATLTFYPRTFADVSGNSEVKIIRHGFNEDTGQIDTRVDVLSGHLSKAIAKNLPPDALFEIVLVDFIPLEAEPYTEPAILRPMGFIPATES